MGLKDSIFFSFCFASPLILETEAGKGTNLVGTYSFRCGKENVRFKKLRKLVRTLCLLLSSMQHFRTVGSLANKGK